MNELTSREREIAMLVAEGLPNKEVAQRLNISEGTVKTHLHRIYRKIGGKRTMLAIFVSSGEFTTGRSRHELANSSMDTIGSRKKL